MTGWIGGVRFGRPGAPAVAAWLLTLISVAVLSAVPLRLAEGAMSVIEDRLDAAPIAETHLEVTTIVDLSKRSIEAPFAPDAAAPPFDVPSMFQHPTVTSSWLDLPRFVARQRNGEPLPFRLRLTLRVVDGFDQVARTIRVADAVAPSDSSAEIVDIAVTEATAHLMRVDLGDVLELTTDPDDPVARAYQGSVLATKVRVAALVELSPPEDPIWFGDDSLHEARQRDTNDGFEVDAAAAVALDDFFLTPSLRPVGGNGTLRQLRSMDAPAPTVSGADEWSLELARMASATPATPPIGTPSGSSRLAALLDDVARSRGQANRTVSATRALLAVLAVVAVVRLITHAVDDQRAALAVWRARGASRRRLTAGATAAGIAASVVAAALGVVVAVVVVGGAATFTRSTIVWPLLAGVGVGSLVGMVVRTVTSRPLGPELRRETVDGGAIQRGVDIVVSVVAVASIIVIVRAGERTETSIRAATIALSALVLTGGIMARRSVIFVARRRRGRSLSTDLRCVNWPRAAVRLHCLPMSRWWASRHSRSSALLAADRSVLVDRSWAVAVAPVGPPPFPEVRSISTRCAPSPVPPSLPARRSSPALFGGRCRSTPHNGALGRPRCGGGPQRDRSGEAVRRPGAWLARRCRPHTGAGPSGGIGTGPIPAVRCYGVWRRSTICPWSSSATTMPDRRTGPWWLPTVRWSSLHWDDRFESRRCPCPPPSMSPTLPRSAGSPA
ncbi:MAG: hypothetical protein R2710_08370 [Acidimicrobiales bacterium]